MKGMACRRNALPRANVESPCRCGSVPIPSTQPRPRPYSSITSRTLDSRMNWTGPSGGAARAGSGQATLRRGKPNADCFARRRSSGAAQTARFCPGIFESHRMARAIPLQIHCARVSVVLRCARVSRPRTVATPLCAGLQTHCCEDLLFC